jgi:hypothetical protein
VVGQQGTKQKIATRGEDVWSTENCCKASQIHFTATDVMGNT